MKYIRSEKYDRQFMLDNMMVQEVIPHAKSLWREM